MPSYGRRSNDVKATLHPDLQRLFCEVIKYIDVSLICGHRDKLTQDAAYYAKPQRSTKKWPDSTHNTFPSKAVDVIPSPFRPEDWKDIARFRHMIGIIEGIAFMMGIKIRSGGDWDRDHDFKDQDFIDLPHIELVED